jgi:hypothetical protein
MTRHARPFIAFATALVLFTAEKALTVETTVESSENRFVSMEVARNAVLSCSQRFFQGVAKSLRPNSSWTVHDANVYEGPCDKMNTTGYDLDSLKTRAICLHPILKFADQEFELAVSPNLVSFQTLPIGVVRDPRSFQALKVPLLVLAGPKEQVPIFDRFGQVEKVEGYYVPSVVPASNQWQGERLQILRADGRLADLKRMDGSPVSFNTAGYMACVYREMDRKPGEVR